MDASRKSVANKSMGNTQGYALFTSGVFFAQLAGNALHVLLPIWVLTLVQKSPSTLAVLLFIFALLDTAGTALGGLLLKRITCSRMVLYASLFRFAAASVFAVLYSTGALPGDLWVWLCALFGVDSLARGVADTGRYTMPLELVNNPKLQLQKANGILQSFFELGAVIGPVMVGLLFTFGHAEVAAWLLALLYACSSAIFFVMTGHVGARNSSQVKSILPKKDSKASSELFPHQQLTTDSSPKLKAIGGSDTIGLRVLLALQGLLTVYPMRALLPAIFAVQVFDSAPLTAWFVAAFGLGGVFGSKFFAWIGKRLELRYQIQLAGITVGILTCMLLTKSVYLHFAGYFLFMFFNTSARLAVLSEVQLISTMAISQLRLVANSTSMFLKIGLGAMLAVPGGLFWSTGFIAFCGCLQILGSYFTEESSLKGTSKEGLLWEN